MGKWVTHPIRRQEYLIVAVLEWSIIRKSHRKNFEEKTVELPHVAGDVGQVRVELFEIADERTEVLSDEHPALFVCQNILNFCQLMIFCKKNRLFIMYV